MGVHDLEKYDEIKEALGIPLDEPIFIIRGQDKLAPTMIDLYALIYMSTAQSSGVREGEAQQFVNEIESMYDEVRAYQKKNPRTVKVPD